MQKGRDEGKREMRRLRSNVNANGTTSYKLWELGDCNKHQGCDEGDDLEAVVD